MKKLLYSLMTLAMLSACSNSDDIPAVTGVDEMTDTPITFQVGMEEAATKAGYAAGELTEGTLGFCMQTAGTDAMEQNTKAKYNGTNRKVEYVSGKWQIDGYPLLWRNANDEVSWQAYYPYSESNVTDGILTVTIPTDQNENGVYDLLYGKGTTTGSASINGIDVKLKHTMSKFIVNITVGTELKDAEIESVVLTGMNTRTYLNLITGLYEGDLEVPANINMIKHEGGKTFEAIILSYTLYNIGLEITLNGGKKFFYKQGLTTFEEGMIHTLNLKVGKDVKTTSLSVRNWSVENINN